MLSSYNSPVAGNHAILDMVSAVPMSRFDITDTDVPIYTHASATQQHPDNDDGDNPMTICDDVHDFIQLDSNRVGTATPDVLSTIPATLGIATPDVSSMIPITTCTSSPDVASMIPITVDQVAFSRRNKKTVRRGTFKPTSQSVHNALRHGISEQLTTSIADGTTKKGTSHSALKTSLGFFETQSYQKQARVFPGQSKWLATKKAKALCIGANDVIFESEKPTFDIKKASKAVSGVLWEDLIPTFCLDSRKLR
jgi:hypothetical protein